MLLLSILPLFVLSLMFDKIISQNLITPCPSIFNYEKGTEENDRWYGNVNLKNENNLSGIWMRIIFDRTSVQLGNWFGEVDTTDNKEYLIKNRNFKLAANTPYQLRFFLKYKPSEPPPQIVEIRLNAKTICPIRGVTTETALNTGLLITSSELATSTDDSRPFGQITPAPPAETGGSSWNGQEIGTFHKPANSGGDDDDYFQGDLTFSTKPNQQGPSSQFETACGTIVTPPRPLITYGQATHEGEFPWHVALYHSRGIDLTYICGASLISRYHVITVAHCVTKRRSQSTIHPDSLVVYLGKYYLKRWSNKGLQDIQVERITVHPNYDASTYNNDIAMIRLATAAEITNYVRPICLWEEDIDLQKVINKAGTVVGWGFDETGKVTDELTKAKMPVVSQETCIYSFPDFFSRFTSTKTFCGGFRNGTSVCNGDSGGGMVFAKSGSNGKIWQLRGLVSISVALQNQFKCDSAHYVVFTDVAKYLDWVRTALN